MKNLPKNHSIYLVFDTETTHPNNPYAHWFDNEIEANNFIEISNKLPKDNIQIMDVYYVECVIDDCGWGTVTNNPALNSTMEQLSLWFANTSSLKQDFEGPDPTKFYLPYLSGEKRTDYRIYKTQLIMNPAIIIAAKKTHYWYLYPISYDRSISGIFDDYELKNSLDKMINRFGFAILYLELLLSIMTVIYLLYIFIHD